MLKGQNQNVFLGKKLSETKSQISVTCVGSKNNASGVQSTNSEDEKLENVRKPTLVYKYEDIELKKIEVDKGIVLRLLDVNGKKFVDIRKYYKGYPTKRGIRFPYELFEEIKNGLTDDLNP